MGTNLLRLSIIMFIIFSFEVYSNEEDPEACDCNTIVISTEEALNGCPANVKSQTCEKFREIVEWQSTLKKQQELRRYEDRYKQGIPSRR